ncbi:MAG: hypothetical protein ABIJ37_07485 [Pseudomonadota bacterium]
MEPKITIVDDCKIRIAGYDCKVGKISQKTIDMTPYAGEYVRIWLEKDGTYSLDKNANHYWQVAELQVPEIPVDLSGVKITTFELPV